MPTYEYACTKCGQHVEVFQRLSEPPLTECGVCGGSLRKVFHPVGIVFKGSGFYATDSRSKPKADTDSRSGAGAGDGGKEARSGSGDAGKEAPSAPPSSSSSSTSSESGSRSAPKRASGEKAS